MNVLKTTLLLVSLTLLMIFIGGAIAGRQGMWFAFIFASIMNFVSYWFSDKIVLAMYRAQPVSQTEAPQLYQMVQELTTQAGMPMPKIYRIPIDTPNAFATGRDPEHAVVAVTDGIMNLLNDQELRGVIGHELSHVKHRDILISSIAATLAGAVSMIANTARWGMMFGGGSRDDREGRGTNPIALLLIIIVAPVAAMLVQLAVSRSREYDADESGAKLSGNPIDLANALRKLHDGVQRRPLDPSAAPTAHLFIVNPLRAGSSLASLFSTHPPVEERIQRLEKMAYQSTKH